MSKFICIRCALSRVSVPKASGLRSFSTSNSFNKEPSSKAVSTRKSTKNVNRRPKEMEASQIKPYTKEEKALLSKKYTPAQMAAIEAGEAAVDPKDIVDQGSIRNDYFALPYQNDDLATIRPVMDFPVQAPEENHDPNMRFKNDDEIAADLADWVQSATKDSTAIDYARFVDNMRLTVGKEEAERNPVSYLAPELPEGLPTLDMGIPKKAGKKIDPNIKRLTMQTGFTAPDIAKLRVKHLVYHRVVNQTRMGKIQSQYYLAIAGNSNGLLGIGEGKSAEPDEARRQAAHNAIRMMQPIPRYENRTIYGDVKVKMGAVELELMTRPPGYGVRCQSLIFEMCKCAGIQDLGARVTRSRNHMNTIKATYKALMSQRIPDDIARGLGKKLVDVRKVYYAGNV